MGQLYVLGLVVALAGNVLPWLRAGGANVWGWDVSVLWSVTGRLSLVRTPPPVGGVALLCLLALAAPVVLGRRPSGPPSAALSALLLGLSGLTAFRAFTVGEPVPPHVGLLATLAGGALLAVASLGYGD